MVDRINISDYDYALPEAHIARYPLAERDRSKLLLWEGGAVGECLFGEIGTHLPEDGLIVFNNTRVIRARIIMHKASGARIEVFCLEPFEPADYERAFAVKGECRWKCIIGNSRRWKAGPLSVRFDYGGVECRLEAFREKSDGKEQVVRFAWDADIAFGQLLEHLGKIPIPPYLGRESEEIDNSRYQTVYSKIEGSVAAPTAGLHFTDSLIGRLKGQGMAFEEVTLHVGAGTFLPVKEENAVMHAMHTEHFEISQAAVRNLISHRGKVTVVGTTTVRTLESLCGLGYRVLKNGTPDAGNAVGQWELYDMPEKADGGELLGTLLGYMERNGLQRVRAATQIMIVPGFRFRVTNMMVTNFHQPRSTLLLLVAAFTGGRWRGIYDYALGHGFRFLSYGDGSLLKP